jgi:hypothetical protein
MKICAYRPERLQQRLKSEGESRLRKEEEEIRGK